MEKVNSEKNHHVQSDRAKAKHPSIPKPIKRKEKSPYSLRPNENMSFFGLEKTGDLKVFNVPALNKKQNSFQCYHKEKERLKRNGLEQDNGEKRPQKVQTKEGNINLTCALQQKRKAKKTFIMPNLSVIEEDKRPKVKEETQKVIESFAFYSKELDSNFAIEDNFSYLKKRNKPLLKAFHLCDNCTKKRISINQRYLDTHKRKCGYGFYSFIVFEYFGKERQYKLKFFQQVYQSLVQFFFGEDMDYSIIEKDSLDSLLFSSILKRKFKIETNQKDSLESFAEKTKTLKTDKRPEECKKLIFSLTIKHMKKQLKEKKKKIYKKKSFENLFYKHYFRRIADKEGLSIHDFYYPISYNKNKKNAFKTINKAYITNIRKSSAFIDDFMNYLDKGLIENYKGEIKSQLFKIVSKWDRDLYKSENEERFKRDLMNNSSREKRKLPWTLDEIQCAISIVRNIITD